jgi:hypothetical protein
MHDTHLVAVDKKGHIRGYYSGVVDAEGSDGDLRRLRDKLAALAREAP